MTLEGGGGGGGGVLAPVTNAVSGIVKGATDVVKGIVQPVYNATLKQIPGVDNALVNLDKSVGKAIPGGWGTVASVAASFIPGGQLAALSLTPTQVATGLGALSGSGVMRKGNQFNLQGAIMGGAMAYGGAKLAEGLQAAGAAKAVEEAAKSGATEGGVSALTGTGSAPVSGASTLTPTANALQNIPTEFVPPINAPTAAQSFAPSGDYGLKNLASNIPSVGINPAASVPSGIGYSAAPSVLDKIATGASNIGGGTLSNVGTAGQGIANLAGFGADGTAAAARAAFSNSVTPTALAAGIMGYSGMAALEEQRKALDQQLASGSIGQAAYDEAKAKIDEQVEAAKATVAANPLQTSADTSNVTEGPSLYTKNSTGFDTLYDKKPTGGTTLYEQSPVKVAGGGIINYYAMGGNVQMNPPDDQTGMINHTPMTNFDQSNTQTGIMSMIGNAAPRQAFAAGGMPRFLSGGGDGMSDSIKANINGRQEARLADGEFVIPADVVSHIGNGSSKAGANQLYSMMDRVRQARVGTKKQGKQINPRKYLAA
jgi:hypothetical protein